MFLARIDGTMTTTLKHETLQSCRFLIGRRLDSEGNPADEPIVVLDRIGARHGSKVIVSTDGDIARKWLGNTAPARMIVVGIVDEVHNGKRRQ